ncbi:MAG: type II secretion system protein GspC [Deltaproteobacteria bacterium]|nr:type II secretion system protein GspC [Deltaproteobacteria bacterium]MBW2052586.1 type II secretion system protein GspC [Deltaproteobacteria bacterium]MBW2141701.1 type II secretion system protein GspC [Deltaproteobacteria bacterium]MBW2323176.1 type II secretion system protein GspC [Deltaproteobacteria bacterium]
MTVSTKYYLWLAHLIILGLIVWSSVNLGSTLLAHRLEDRVRGQATVKVAKNLAPRLRTLNEYDAIVRNNIFAPETKETPASTASVPMQEAEIKKSNSNYRLKGTIISQRSESSFAVLEAAKSREQNLFRTGDMVGEAELIEINPGEVLLRENGKIQRLKIDEPASKPALRGRRTHTARTTKTQTQKIAQAVGLNKYVVSRDIINQDMTDLYKFMSQINIQPYKKSGKPHGFRVSSIRPNSIFYQLGLRNNDVIVKLNGVAIRQPEDIMGLYQQIKELDNVTMEVERRGRPTSFNYSLR